MKRYDILNGLISKHGLKRFIEIGVNRGDNFNKIICHYKVSVDPEPECHATFQMTSDNFFQDALFGNLLDETAREWKKPVPFDCALIDGLHHDDQVERDVTNMLQLLTHDGYIVCHDCNPQLDIYQRVPRETRIWNGSTWKAIVKLRNERPDLSIVTVDTDEGCAIISRHGKKYPFRLTRELTYENLSKHREEWLNLVSIEEFRKRYL